MNVERLEELALWLEAGAPERDGVAEFNMNEFVARAHGPACGTACCIAGSAIQFERARQKMKAIPAYSHADFHGQARDLLCLSAAQAEALFYGYACIDGNFTDEQDMHLSKITPAWAARCIRHLMATGDVDWLATQE